MLKCGSGQVCNVELNDESEQSHIRSRSTSAFSKTTLKASIWPDRVCSVCYTGQIATKIGSFYRVNSWILNVHLQ